MEHRVYRGWIEEREDGEYDDAIFLRDGGEWPRPLAERVAEDMADLGNFLSVRYFVSDQERSADDLIADVLFQLEGDGHDFTPDGYGGHSIRYETHYSEITGYLWTDELLRIGGHDLLEELRSKVGKFCHLDIGFSRTPPTG
jgi:hypothetical protein